MPFQGLLAVPFVLHSHPTAVFEPNDESVEHQASIAQRRYAEILRDVEEIINDHSMLRPQAGSYGLRQTFGANPMQFSTRRTANLTDQS
jgi:hypothetical protein